MQNLSSSADKVGAIRTPYKSTPLLEGCVLSVHFVRVQLKPERFLSCTNLYEIVRPLISFPFFMYGPDKTIPYCGVAFASEGVRGASEGNSLAVWLTVGAKPGADRVILPLVEGHALHV
jgi:hypothetical protein